MDQDCTQKKLIKNNARIVGHYGHTFSKHFLNSQEQQCFLNALSPGLRIKSWVSFWDAKIPQGAKGTSVEGGTALSGPLRVKSSSWKEPLVEVLIIKVPKSERRYCLRMYEFENKDGQRPMKQHHPNNETVY